MSHDVYQGFLPSGALVTGSKHAIQEMQAAIWRAQPSNDCAGQTYRDFAERCDRARQETEQRAVEAKKLAEELVGVSSLRAPQSGRDYKALAEAYLDERVLVETMPRKRPDLVRDFAKWLAGSGAETPPQPTEEQNGRA